MIKHIVCFKIKEEYKNRIEEAKNTLLSMKGRVPTVIDINVGIDLLRSNLRIYGTIRNISKRFVSLYCC